MANWRSFGDRMPHCGRSMLKKTWCNCSNPAAGFHKSTCGGRGGDGLFSPVRSSEYFIRLGGRSVGVFKKGATFSLIQRYFSSSSSGVVVDEEQARGGISTTLLGPLPLRSAPYLMLPAGSGLVAQGEGESYKLVTMEDENRDYYQFFSLREKKVVKIRKNNHRLLLPWQREILSPDDAICFGSSRGWVAFIHPRNCSLYLFNPFVHSYLPYLPLPPIQTLPCVISCVRYNNPNIHTSSSSSPPSINNNNNNNNNIVTEFTIWRQFSPISSQVLSQTPLFKKIVLSSAPSSFPSNHHRHENINNSSEKIKYSSDCTVLVIQGYEENMLAFCRIGDTAWTALDGAANSYFDLMYFSKDQKFYALSTSYDLIEAWDLSNPDSPKNTVIISHLPPPEHPTMDKHQRRLRRWLDCENYLVESSGELLMVVRFYTDDCPEIIRQENSPCPPRKTVLFDVYKLDFVNKEWLLLPSLGDRALFVGLSESISVSAIDFPGLAMNRIYFTRHDTEFPQDSHDLGIFNLEDNSITPIYHYDLNIQHPSPWIVPAQQ